MMNRLCRLMMAILILGLGPTIAGPDGFAAEVNGIYTEPTTKDLGVVTGIKPLEGIKTSGWISVYYDDNLNHPPVGTLIGGRTFDVRDQTFQLELAEVELEKVPNPGEVGFKFDLATGDTQDQILQGIRTFYGAGSVTEAERTEGRGRVSAWTNHEILMVSGER